MCALLSQDSVVETVRYGFLTAVFFLLTSAANAQPEPPPPLQISTSFSHHDCPTQKEIEQELRARDLSFRSPRQAEAATHIKISIAPQGDDLLGVLELQLLTGEHVRREIRGASCEEVARSLTLVAALALAPLETFLRSPAPPATAPSTSPSAPPPAPPPTARAPLPSQPPARWSAGVEVGAMNGLGPRISPGLGPWLQRSREKTSLRLGVSYWPHGSVRIDSYRAEFSAILLDLSGCFYWPLPKEIDGSLCIGAHGGRIYAEGSQIEESRSASRPWLAPHAGGRIAWTPKTGGLVEFNLGMYSPVIRDSFFFEAPRREVHQPPKIGFWSSIGGGFSFL